MTWEGKAKQDKHRSRDEGVGTKAGPCSAPSNPDTLGPFSALFLTLLLGVVLLHFEALLGVEGVY